MTKENFVEAIKFVVTEGTKKGIKDNLYTPPGRRPSLNRVELSNWYLNLSSPDQEMIQRVIAETAEFNTFSFLCVLDGVSVIEPASSRGTLTLTYEKGGISFVLNRFEAPFLHDLL